MDIGSFISAVIYFVIFMAIIYFVIIVPYKHIQARRGQVVFGDPPRGQDLPGVPVQRPAGRRVQVQVLRHGPARHRRRLTPPRCGSHRLLTYNPFVTGERSSSTAVTQLRAEPGRYPR